MKALYKHSIILGLFFGSSNNSLAWQAQELPATVEPSQEQIKEKAQEKQQSDASRNNDIVKLEQTENKIKTALSNKEYVKAIQLLERLFKKGNKQQQAFALEFLGLAYDKNNQKAQAKKQYQLYLKLYPDNKSAARVKIRLDNLLGIETLTQNRTLKKAKFNKKINRQNFHRGSISTDYRQSMLVDNNGDSQDTMSLLSTDLNARGSFTQSDNIFDYRVSVGRYQDLQSNSDKSHNQIRYLNFSAKTDDNLYQMKFGRQRSRGKGIFGRFDGLVLSSEWQPGLQFNIAAGYPVASSKITSIDPERQFYSLSLDVNDLWSGLDFSVFYFDQTINDLTDRRAIGGEFKYHQKNASYFGLVDYDIFFNQLNAAMLSGNHVTQSQQRLSWSINYRKNPYIGTRNALIGQSADSLAELQNLFITDEEILDLALDRTLESTTATLQFSQPINKQFDFSSSLTWMNLSGAPESGGVPAIGESGGQYYLNLYLGGKRLYSQNDYNTIGFRYSNLASSQVYSTYVTSRYKINKEFSVSAKFRFDNRNSDNGTSQQNISPTLRLQYQSKQHYLYSDIGGIFYNTKSDLFPSQESKIYYVYLGYRWFF